ncbi:hypothetical protein [Clostridium gasigenes]|uniref:Uncharacterized protein n=1 Tax=Clostridium gasigenes TaxID=94869 RepID=A0A1H0S6K5_9CLOT|nr:hypothetical protein [Clostridium gasigenes]MBB6622748.1 hypothetical protein [Clostridium gasigenes]MBU3089494.1 hypothetical protein [Clostridium gasigenes]MBU3103725.1 hypothetical protein [Clostridium gasigenes]MBU3132935.1 hypothetical protein [Clostridium gasigenes]SDP37275.1 hypothetical protein SAMN04488529_104187 [Clostridium gasigenes]
MDDFLSTGVVRRPVDTKILRIVLRNTSQSLAFQSIYIYNWDTGSAVLVDSKNYFVSANGFNTIDFPLVINGYGDTRNIILYEVYYGPTSPDITVTFSNI